MLLAIGAGLLADLAVRRLLRNRAAQSASTVPASTPPSLRRTLPSIGIRYLREIAGVLVSYGVLLALLAFAMPSREVPVAVILAHWLFLLPRLCLATLRFLLAPSHPEMRLLHADDGTAQLLFRNFGGIAFLVGIGLALISLNRHFGAPTSFDRVAFWINAAVFVWLSYVFLRARTGIRQIVQGPSSDIGDGGRWLTQVYPWMALVLIIGTWCLGTATAALGADDIIRGGRHLISLAILLAAPLLDTMIRSIAAELVPPMRGEGATAERAHRANLRGLTRIGRVVVFGVVILVTASLWDVTLFNVAAAGLGEQFAANLVRAVLVCVMGYIAWEITRLIVNHKLADEMTNDDDRPTDEPGLGGAAPSSRLSTILPPISWVLQAIIIMLTVLTALSNLGVDVTPLLAGAGIAGIAIGFGAQKLVSDVVSGLFFLIDDAFRLNEYIDAGGVQGTVEKIALRSLRLRDANGPILNIPYSNISTVTNFGRDWGIMKLKFTVPFDTDTEKVRKLFKKIGQDMMQVPELAAGFIEPFKGLGVGEVNDVGIVVRSKFMHRPGAQFAIRREIFRRVQEEFAKNGIQFARREVRVSVQEGAAVSPEQAGATAAAAMESGTAPATLPADRNGR